jgi:hypothetical protein
MPSEQPKFFYHAPRCLFCDKNNKRRHARRGRTWICEFCGEANPGPGMLKAIVGRFITPPATTKAGARGNGAAEPQPAKVTATKIKGASEAPKVAPTAAAPAKEVAPAAEPVTPPAAPAAGKGILDRVLYGN